MGALRQEATISDPSHFLTAGGVSLRIGYTAAMATNPLADRLETGAKMPYGWEIFFLGP
jgi:hypothetical protein